MFQNHADPFLRNCRKESALDLAAQYGRMENVSMQLSTTTCFPANIADVAAYSNITEVVADVTEITLSWISQCHSIMGIAASQHDGYCSVMEALVSIINIPVLQKSQHPSIAKVTASPYCKSHSIPVLQKSQHHGHQISQCLKCCKRHNIIDISYHSVSDVAVPRCIWQLHESHRCHSRHWMPQCCRYSCVADITVSCILLLSCFFLVIAIFTDSKSFYHHYNDTG